ncbi:MAG TPA: hypothetical protein VEX68_09920 [Bryobacteraceae bacterium]|nr:hypothetical protein [Bryobacteraceae bacterium]
MIISLGSPVALVVFTCLAAVGHTYIVPREEMALKRQFDEEYRLYCARVPRSIIDVAAKQLSRLDPVQVPDKADKFGRFE